MSRLMLVVVGFASAFAFAGGRPSGTGDCDSMADLIFILDESGSIKAPSFAQLLAFVTNITDSIEVGVNHTRVGVMTYAEEPRVIYNLSQSQTNDAVRNVTKSIKQAGGPTYTDRALRKLHEAMLTSGLTRLQGSRKVAVVITDGLSTDPNMTKAEATRAQLKGVLIVAIGVGDQVNYEELQAIAGSDGSVFTVNDYSALGTIRNAVVTKACGTTALCPTATTKHTPKPITGCPGTKTLDLIWAVSNQAGVEETKAALDLIASTVSEMLLGPDVVQVGLAPRSGDGKAGIHLNNHSTHGQFFKDLEERELSGAQTDRAIEYIRTKGMSPQNGARCDSVKYGILIVDNQPEDWSNTFLEAKLAKKAQIRLIVITVGKNVRRGHTKGLASSAEDNLHVNGYGAFDELKTRIIDRLCQGII